MVAAQKIKYDDNSCLLYTRVTIPRIGTRPFVLLPKDGDPHTLVLWVSESDEQESKFVQAVKSLSHQILWDAARLDNRVTHLVLKFD